MSMPDNLLRNNKKVMYRLKRQFGLSGYVRWMVSNEYDRLTGERDVVYDSLKVRRIIMLPDARMLQSLYSGPFYQAGREFTYGAYFDEHSRTCIIDTKDLSGRTLQSSDQFVIRNRPYTLKKFTLAEELSSYLVQLTLLDGEPNVQPASS